MSGLEIYIKTEKYCAFLSSSSFSLSQEFQSLDKLTKRSLLFKVSFFSKIIGPTKNMGLVRQSFVKLFTLFDKL